MVKEETEYIFVESIYRVEIVLPPGKEGKEIKIKDTRINQETRPNDIYIRPAMGERIEGGEGEGEESYYLIDCNGGAVTLVFDNQTWFVLSSYRGKSWESTLLSSGPQVPASGSAPIRLGDGNGGRRSLKLSIAPPTK